MIAKEEIKDWFIGLQGSICKQLEEADGNGKFIADQWERPGGGGGISRVLSNGKIIEKGGVNFSAVWGQTPAPTLKTLGLASETQSEFFATGVSIVLHPASPMVPIIHMNVRYFEMSNGIWWFGGGIDLTPHYLVEEDAQYFHKQLKAVCDQHHPSYYRDFKNWADDYFFIKHRNETRGIGGIFFDNLKADNGFTKESRFEFVKSVGLSFAPIYTYFMKKNSTLPYSEKEKQWQYLRRGRYVEFNLVWDRGTKFGLETDGRTESILMSLPPQANWVYNFSPEANSAEAKTLLLLKKGIDWV
ncbi:oxygen-dependent coproporphyrinogen oxidase [Chryseosolibacter indicus]|uniref:coproporphyrinogen oxidase n=1 Tax=Chryseosolibacter indicus TaxID=2782351 RepID=A0ABS5VP71_9BACT|nr:oxygen-dependent coproporphyrinogen oxidase [Chryseosolibacter indicus]MBT1703245.1 oxygen-dependent coproporphyrinogen oxidase [Chryseosolibacter indicus]